MSPAKLPVFELDAASYGPTQSLQRRLRGQVAQGRLPGALILAEHPPVITLGTRGGLDHLRSAGAGPVQVPVVASERGGAATLHGPGQLVSYPVMPIPGRNLRRYVLGLEEVLRCLVSFFGITAIRSERRPGLYVEDRKIASVGLRCERWVASHGTSLNVSIDLALFDNLVCCGEPDLRQTSIQEEVDRSVRKEDVRYLYRQHFAEVFEQPLADPRQLSLEEIEALLGLEENDL